MFHDTLQIIPNGILILDILSKDIAYANKELEKLISQVKCSSLSLKDRIFTFKK